MTDHMKLYHVVFDFDQLRVQIGLYVYVCRYNGQMHQRLRSAPGAA